MYDFILFNGNYIQFYCCKKECIKNENLLCKLQFPIDFYDKQENKEIIKKLCKYYLNKSRNKK